MVWAVDVFECRKQESSIQTTCICLTVPWAYLEVPYKVSVTNERTQIIPEGRNGYYGQISIWSLTLIEYKSKSKLRR